MIEDNVIEAEEWRLSLGSEGAALERGWRNGSNKKREPTKRRLGDTVTGRESGWGPDGHC